MAAAVEYRADAGRTGRHADAAGHLRRRNPHGPLHVRRGGQLRRRRHGPDHDRRTQLRHHPRRRRAGTTSSTARPSAAPARASASRPSRAARCSGTSSASPSPYFFDTNVSFNASGFYFDRNYFDWNESRVGGRLAWGYRLTPDLSVSAALRMEQVEIFDPRRQHRARAQRRPGDERPLSAAGFSITHDTRDLPFMPTEGHLIELSFEQAFGTFDYPARRGRLQPVLPGPRAARRLGPAHAGLIRPSSASPAPTRRSSKTTSRAATRPSAASRSAGPRRSTTASASAANSAGSTRSSTSSRSRPTT